jgi:hypothetical protein
MEVSIEKNFVTMQFFPDAIGQAADETGAGFFEE